MLIAHRVNRLEKITCNTELSPDAVYQLHYAKADMVIPLLSKNMINAICTFVHGEFCVDNCDFMDTYLSIMSSLIRSGNKFED